jgi:hypothetical protein
MPISDISQQRATYSRYKLKNQFPVGNAGKLSSMNMKGLSANSSLQQEPHVYS